MFMVSARKYRPQRFDEVVGQNHIARTLKNAILNNRVAHAYLFCGTRGVGKTSMARIFAKALNCPNAKEGEPCNECETCQAISQSVDMDVLEVDGASHRGVEDIGFLREGSKYRPTRSKFKIYIIDEVHMLTRHAFNALLKTLEEPPSHVKFIFATTEPHKLPETIVSRCQRFDFKRISPEDIVTRLKQILQQEKVEAEEEALYLIAESAKGGMRDSQSLLDQAVAFCGKKLTAQEVSQILGVLPPKDLERFIKMLMERDTEGLLEFLDQLYWKGVDFSEFLGQVMEGLRNLLAVKTLKKKAKSLRGSSLSEKWVSLAEKASLQDLLVFLQVLMETRRKVALEPQPRILVEMALIYLTNLQEFIPLSQASSLVGSSPASHASQSSSKEVAKEIKKKSLRARTEPGSEKEAPLEVGNDLKPFWPEILKRAVKKFPGFASSLKKGKFFKVIDNNIVLHFSKDDSIHKDILEENKGLLKELQDYIRSLTGNEYGFHLVIEENNHKEKTSNKSSVVLEKAIVKAMEIFSGDFYFALHKEQQES